MKYADLNLAEALARLLEPLREGAVSATTTEASNALKDAEKSVAERLKAELATEGGDA